MGRILVLWFSIISSSSWASHIHIKDHLTDIKDPAQCGTRAILDYIWTPMNKWYN
jgi:hypothetical protein